MYEQIQNHFGLSIFLQIYIKTKQLNIMLLLRLLYFQRVECVDLLLFCIQGRKSRKEFWNTQMGILDFKIRFEIQEIWQPSQGFGLNK